MLNVVIADQEFKTFALAPAEAKTNLVGRCVLIHLTLTNAGPTDIPVTTVLSAAELRPPYGQVWPDEENKAWRGYYAGYHRSMGEYRMPPVAKARWVQLNGAVRMAAKNGYVVCQREGCEKSLFLGRVTLRLGG